MGNFFKKIFNICKAAVGAVWDECKITLFGGGVAILGAIVVGVGGLIAISSFPAIIVLAIYGQWGFVIAGLAGRILVTLGLMVFEKIVERGYAREAKSNA